MTQLRDYGRQIESDPILGGEGPAVDVASRPAPPRVGRGLAWAVAAFAVVLAVGGLYLAFSGGDGQVVDQTTVPTPTTVLEPEPTVVSGMWPQSSLEEAEDAQDLADAGDPSVTWQLEPALDENLLTATGDVASADIVVRFLREELGWDEFLFIDHHGGASDGTVTFMYIRCTPGEVNSLYPDDPDGRTCAPTINDVAYETVAVTVGQPVRRGSSGIWVVTQWGNVEPFEQAAPPTEAEATALLEGFLQARIEGEGAEQYFGRGGGSAPLLYTTSSGNPYQRFEFELVSGPGWPSDPMQFEVRLFAEDGQTMVEQSFTVEPDGEGVWGLETGSETLENGRALPGLHDILGGQVTFHAPLPWDGTLLGPSFDNDGLAADVLLMHPDGHIKVLADPLPMIDRCGQGPAPTNAASLAQSIMSDDDFEATAPSSVTIGGAPALQLDVVNPGAPSVLCDQLPRASVTTSILEPGSRMRLYLVDLPGGSARILSIAIVAPESSFESVVEAAAPILDSFEFHTG
jgi:hypothetical protein